MAPRGDAKDTGNHDPGWYTQVMKGLNYKRKRVDDNQLEIIKALKKVGCSVADTSGAGEGFPDLVVGKAGKNWLIEVKDGNKPPSKRKLTPSQGKFHSRWLGQIAVVKDPETAIAVVSG